MKADALKAAEGVRTARPCFDGGIGNGSIATRLKEILVLLDLSAESAFTLQYAVSFAQRFGAKLTLLHVLRPPICMPDFPYPGPGGRDCFEVIKDLLEDVRARNVPPGIRAETMVRQAFAVDGILDVAREIHADLIVVGIHGGERPMHFFRKGIAESLARRATCRVLVARPGDGV